MSKKILLCDAPAYLKIESLKHHPENPRTIEPDRLEDMKRSIIQKGVYKPILVWSEKNIILEGNHRVKAVKELIAEGYSFGHEGFKGNVLPVVILSVDKATAFKILIESNTSYARWIDDLLREQLINAQKAGDNLLDYGLTEDQISKIVSDASAGANAVLSGLGGSGGTGESKKKDADEIPEAPRVIRGKLGDVIRMGKHRLLIGDSTKAESVKKLFGSNKAVLMVTDPPYGVKLDQSWRDKALGDKALGKGNKKVVKNDDCADWTETWKLAPIEVAYVWHASLKSEIVLDSLRKAGFEAIRQIIWNKNVMAMSRSDYHWKHEPCWYVVKNGAKHHWISDDRTAGENGRGTTVWEAAPPNHIMAGSKEERTEHPTQKPAVLYEIPILNHLNPGEVLYEPFSGSGTAFIACEKLGRICFGIELDPEYVEIIIERWQNFTGEKAYRIDSDGSKTEWNKIKGKKK